MPKPTEPDASAAHQMSPPGARLSEPQHLGLGLVSSNGVASIAIQSDGKMLVGGDFFFVDGFIRLRADPQMRFLSLTRPTAGSTQLVLDGPAGTLQRIEHSSDLRTWSELGVISLRGCPEVLTDATATGSRFYRAVLVQP